jgi:16S rRNA (guanine527-N7)-methyltransferase
MVDIIFKYFPELTAHQRSQMAQLEELYRDWNSKINVVSRKDIDMLYTHHVLHSLAIAKVIQFAKETKIVDIGTGGGFPGIPLAIMFPNCHFTLVDSIGKKVRVAQEVSQALQLKNVTTLKARAEDMKGKYDFVVTRAVAPLATLSNWTRGLIKPGGYNFLPNGIIALKGGNLKEELAPLGRKVEKWKISDFFEEEYFSEKYMIFAPIY